MDEDLSTMPKDSKTEPWHRWVEVWYLAYALLGMVSLGLVLILLPLAVEREGNAAHVGLVMAALYLGGVSAPLWGNLADRYRLHRWEMAAGLALAAVALVFFAVVQLVSVWVGLALLLGIGIAASTTMGNLVIVEAHPKQEWNRRIAWLQTFNGVGRMIGMLLAGFLSQYDMRLALLVAAGVAAAGALAGWLTVPTPPEKGREPAGEREELVHPPHTADWGHGSSQHLFHLHLSWPPRAEWLLAMRSRFGLFLLVWMMATMSSAAILAVYPLTMQNSFGLTPAISSVLLAAAVGASTLVYTPAGRWSERFGSVPVMNLALGVRILAVLALGILAVVGYRQVWAIVLFFILSATTVALLKVTTTNLAGRLSPLPGVGMGLYSAAFYLGGVLGAIITGFVAHHWGYESTLFLAAFATSLALVFSVAGRLGRGVEATAGAE